MAGVRSARTFQAAGEAFSEDNNEIRGITGIGNNFSEEDFELRSIYRGIGALTRRARIQSLLGREVGLKDNSFSNSHLYPGKPMRYPMMVEIVIEIIAADVASIVGNNTDP